MCKVILTIKQLKIKKSKYEWDDSKDIETNLFNQLQQEITDELDFEILTKMLGGLYTIKINHKLLNKRGMYA